MALYHTNPKHGMQYDSTREFVEGQQSSEFDRCWLIANLIDVLPDAAREAFFRNYSLEER